MDKYEYLTGEEILFHDQRRVIEQAAFAYSPLGQAFERKKKQKNWRPRKKQVEALKALIEEEELESIEGFFQKIWELMKLKMKQMKLKNRKIKLHEKI